MSNSLTVSLNVYDLADQNQYAHPLGLGAYHTGIEINGIEWSYGHAERGTGVYPCLPGSHPNAKFREKIRIKIQHTLTIEEVARCLDRLRPAFMGYRYHLLFLNCNHFTEALHYELTNERAPSYINRLAQVARCCICFMPDYMQPRPGIDSVLKWAWWRLPNHQDQLQQQQQQQSNDVSGLELVGRSEERGMRMIVLQHSGENSRFDQSSTDNKIQKDDDSDEFNPSDLLIPRSPLNETFENAQGLIRSPLTNPLTTQHHNTSHSNHQGSSSSRHRIRRGGGSAQRSLSKSSSGGGGGGVISRQPGGGGATLGDSDEDGAACGGGGALGDEQVFIGDDQPEVGMIEEEEEEEEEGAEEDEGLHGQQVAVGSRVAQLR